MYDRHLKIMLYRPENMNFLSLTTGLLSFIASLALVVMVLGNQAFNRWDIDLTSNITVQVSADFENPKDAAKNLEYRLDKAEKLLSSKNYLGEVRIISLEESKQMLQPWLGGEWSAADFPLPRLIAARVVDANAFSSKSLSAELNSKVGHVVLEDHLQRLDKTRAAAAALRFGILVVVAFIALGLALACAYCTKTALSINRDILEILTNVGAAEAYIARLFGSRILLAAAIGSLAGTALSLPVFGILNAMLVSVAESTLLGSGELAWIAAIPISFMTISWFTAQFIVYHHLRRLYV